MPSFTAPALPNLISKDVPDINTLLSSLARMDYTGVTDIPVNTVRFNRTSKLFEIYNGTTWASAGKLAHDVETVDGYSANPGQVANTIPVRDANKKIPGDITGKAASAVSAETLSATLPVSKGGTGATTSASARANLGVSYGIVAGTVAQGNDTRVVNALNKTGDTMTGKLTIAAATVLSLSSSSLQERIQIYGTAYTMGVHADTLYLRTAKGFNIYKGGSHLSAGGPGEGGTELLKVTGDGEVIIPGRIETGTGAYLKGNLLFKIQGQTHGVVQPLRFRADSGVTDTTVMLQGNGLLLVGAGEAATSYYAKYGPSGNKEVNDSSEVLGLLADNVIQFVTNIQNSASNAEFRAQLNGNGTFFPLIDATGNIGGAANGWNNSFAYNAYSMPSSATDRSWVKIWPRERRTATTIFYLETNGNDSNSGRDAAKPMKTFAALMNRIYTEYDFNGTTIQIMIGKGTWSNQTLSIYTDRITNPGYINIIGQGVDSTIINPNEGGGTRLGINIEGPPSIYSVRIKNLQITNATEALRVRRGVSVLLGDIRFGTAAVAGSGFHVSCSGGSRVYTNWEGTLEKPVAITHKCGTRAPQYLYAAGEEGRIVMDYVHIDIDIKSSIATSGFASVSHGASLYSYDTTRTKFTGYVSGRRLYVYHCGRVFTSGRTEYVFPGQTLSYVDAITGGYVDKMPQAVGGGRINTSVSPKLYDAYGIVAGVRNQGTLAGHCDIDFKESFSHENQYTVLFCQEGTQHIGCALARRWTSGFSLETRGLDGNSWEYSFSFIVIKVG